MNVDAMLRLSVLVMINVVCNCLFVYSNFLRLSVHVLLLCVYMHVSVYLSINCACLSICTSVCYLDTCIMWPSVLNINKKKIVIRTAEQDKLKAQHSTRWK